MWHSCPNRLAHGFHALLGIFFWGGGGGGLDSAGGDHSRGLLDAPDGIIAGEFLIPFDGVYFVPGEAYFFLLVSVPLPYRFRYRPT